jgi:N-acetylneuraminic acid mutarotase
VLRILRSVERFDQATEQWELRAPMPVGRAYAACAASPRAIVVLGGVAQAHDVLASVDLYYADADAWVTLQEALPRPLYGHHAAIVGAELCVVGGRIPADGTRTRRFSGTADGEATDPSSRTMHRWCLATGARVESPAPAAVDGACVALRVPRGGALFA